MISFDIASGGFQARCDYHTCTTALNICCAQTFKTFVDDYGWYYNLSGQVFCPLHSPVKPSSPSPTEET